MLWGYGLHNCFGAHINRVTLPSILKPLLARTGLRRAAGAAGWIDTGGHAVPRPPACGCSTHEPPPGPGRATMLTFAPMVSSETTRLVLRHYGVPYNERDHAVSAGYRC